MNQKIKITFGVLGLLILGVVLFIAVGLYGMEIEDTYGDNQDIFYGSGEGDIVVNHTTKESGKIIKTWTRIYVTNNFDTVDIRNWWDDKNIEIYRPSDSECWERKFDYGDIERLRDEGKLELKRKVR